MYSSVRMLALALVLLPRISAASALEVTVEEPMRLAFGPWGAHFSADHILRVLLDGVLLVDPEGADQIDDFTGQVEFEAGPLLSLTLSGNADRTESHYVFGPGTLTLTAAWTDRHGAPAQGSFVAPLLSLEVDLCEQELSAETCDVVFNQSYGEFVATFGPGLFDSSLAHAFGIGRRGQLSPFHFDLDDVSGGPSSLDRIGGSTRGQETLDIEVALPEPSPLSLLLISSLAALQSGRIRARRRRSQTALMPQSISPCPPSRAVSVVSSSKRVPSTARIAICEFRARRRVRSRRSGRHHIARRRDAVPAPPVPRNQRGNVRRVLATSPLWTPGANGVTGRSIVDDVSDFSWADSKQVRTPA